MQVLVREQPGSEPRLTVGGRTDAGVHARGQVAHLDVPAERAPSVTARRLNGVLGKRGASDVVVHEVQQVSSAFDARFGALSRRYEYRVRGAGTRRDPLTARFTAEVPRELDLEAMQTASEQLLGLQDFTTFC
ncbi:MAG: tRNA pseudouridine(38-40) synthase TruA, partial [Leucobacter sp.]|nr:tRNA pseudouridine(38-40) synthase TruA [Leucobacter sp.]